MRKGQIIDLQPYYYKRDGRLAFYGVAGITKDFEYPSPTFKERAEDLICDLVLKSYHFYQWLNGVDEYDVQ